MVLIKQQQMYVSTNKSYVEIVSGNLQLIVWNIFHYILS